MIFGIRIKLNLKVKVTKKQYQLTDILTKLDHT